jgi:cytochrome c oxidase subunit 4
VAVTQIALGTFTVGMALLIAAIKSSFVLGIFMHLKFENKLYTVVVIAVIVLISSVIIITLMDYIYR